MSAVTLTYSKTRNTLGSEHLGLKILALYHPFVMARAGRLENTGYFYLCLTSVIAVTVVVQTPLAVYFFRENPGKL